MHTLPKKFYFIKNFNTLELRTLNSNVAIVYRNYYKKPEISELLAIKKFCRKRNIKIYLSNHFKLALKLGFDGAYIPSFNQSITHLNYKLKKNFLVLGSAHNLKEMRVKETQKASLIFLSSVFKKNKNYLGLYKFINLTKLTNTKIIALGGIKKENIRRLLFTRYFGYAGISYFE